MEGYQASLEAFRASGVDFAQCAVFRRPEPLSQAIKSALAAKATCIFVGGGDGSQSLAASLMAGSECALGVVPLGTGNALARDLEIPSGPPEAISTLVSGRCEAIDLGALGHKTFVNVATLGLTARIASALVPDAKKRWGKLAYLVPIVRALAEMRPFDLEVMAKEGSCRHRVVQVVVGCGRYHAGPFLLDRIASNQDGVLRGYCVKHEGRAALLKYGLALLAGDVSSGASVEPFSGTEIQIRTSPTRRFIVDGEPGPRAPQTIRCLPRALQVIVPASWPSEQS